MEIKKVNTFDTTPWFLDNYRYRAKCILSDFLMVYNSSNMTNSLLQLKRYIPTLGKFGHLNFLRCHDIDHIYSLGTICHMDLQSKTSGGLLSWNLEKTISIAGLEYSKGTWSWNFAKQLMIFWLENSRGTLVMEPCKNISKKTDGD